ncbi:AAA-like domain-containing protein [Sphingomonas aerolata]|uniref:AAA-like domain-containing protein n=1 Tax=Sphingomonas aerolata TaxID=185951 RepID=UPI00141A9933|nr:AAA-like domain-containing protein [Sphingomonas aerolata]NII58039.1 hypothetical protein [Sphingomonas aerolata]
MSTNPGYHPDVNVSAYPTSIRKAIQRVASNFYVTRSFDAVQIGNSRYWALLVRPTDEFSIYINTDREVVALFSEYENFEIRTLEAYDDIYDQLESKRVDKSVRFLISGDHRIESIIKHYLNQHPEYPIVIPTTIDILSISTGNHLLEAVRRNYLIRDLFGYQNPLREETFFFGRQEVVNNVLDMARSGQNSSLFGLRKSGKTSAIYAIQRKAKGFSCNVTVIDCQNPAVHARTFDGLLSFIISEVKKSIGFKSTYPDLGKTLPEVSEQFFQHMKNALSVAKNNIILIFDEIENISPSTAASPHWRSGNDSIYFWQILRSFSQSESKGKLSICIVGTSPYILETAKINDVDNPIYLFAPKTYIPNLSFEETKDMVERLGYFMGLEFSPEIIAKLQMGFGGHPFFTRQVCSKIHQQASPNRPLKVSEAALERANTAFYGQLEGYLRDIITQLRNAYPEEFDILHAVVEGQKDEIAEYGRDAPDLIDHLLGYGLIERSGDDFDIKFEAIKTALRRLFPQDDTSTEGRWAEISKRRNSIETEIRTTLFHWARSVSADDWNSILDLSLTNKRREGLISSEPAFLFSSKTSPLYLSDLLMLLKQSLVLPYLDERRSIVTRHLDTINKLRRDAHATTVSDDEMSSIRAAFDYIEGEFAPP